MARATLPVRARRWLRRAARQAPHRLRDFPKDAVGLFAPRAFGGPMPPAGLRARVGLTGSRDEFTLVGRQGAREILETLSVVGEGRREGAWLDFGCGCGRLARPLIESGVPRSYSGVDVDARQIEWAARNLEGRFTVMRPEPPLGFPDASFDVVLAISIFTHLAEAEQFAWLSEIRRLLRPGGLLVATTLPPEFASGVPGLTEEELARLSETGFLAVDHGASTFNEKSTFHGRTYLEKAWSPYLRLRSHEPRGFVSYQDLAVWERAPDPPG
jgi:2-polyprenyl-3-methyl-5-hydroxy-6-metoxy-1,4-benzoquinol methylase